MRKLRLSVLFILFMLAQTAQAQILSVENYLNLVKEKNTKFLSVQANIDAVKGKLAEIERVYSYSLKAGINYLNDQSGRTYSPDPLTDKTENISYDVSVDKEFETGTKITLGFNGSYGEYDYTNFGGSREYDLHDLAPFISLEQSLLKNYNGESTKASLSMARAKAKSALYLLEYQKQSIILEAKLAYWNLSYARTVVDFRNTSLERTKKVYEWNQRRFNIDLAEKSDLLQAQAAVKTRELNLKLAKENEIKAMRAFNKNLNITDDNVDYEVDKFIETGTNFDKNKKLEKKGIRYDVLSALEDVQSVIYEQISSQKILGSDLVLSGAFTLNGVDSKLTEAGKYSLKAEHPTFTLGLRYTMPLDFKLRKTINQGYESSKTAAQNAAEYAAVQEKNEWLQLVDNWNNAKSRLAMAIEIESIQKQRNEENSNLLKKGRTTTYLVLQSEQDLDDATLNVFQGILELIGIYEQAEAFYGVNNEIELK